MATRTRHPNGNLEAAMALLIQNHVALAAQHAKFLELWAQTQQRMDERWAETQKIFARIDTDLDAIKAVLVRHEAILERLPEAIREKIGFKGL